MAGINPRATPYLDTIRAAAQQYNVPPSLLYGLTQQESGFNPRAVSPSGAIGMTQMLPSTAKQYGVNPYDPVQSIYGAAMYLNQANKRYGNWSDAVGSYNMGMGGMDAVLAGRRSIPAETRNYIPAVLSNAQKFDSLTNGGTQFGYSPNRYGFSDSTGSYNVYPSNQQDVNVLNDLNQMPESDSQRALNALAILHNANNNSDSSNNSWLTPNVPKGVLKSVVNQMQMLGI